MIVVTCGPHIEAQTVERRGDEEKDREKEKWNI